MLEPLAHIGDFQNSLFLGELQGHVGGDRIRQAAGLFDARQRGEDLGRHLLVQFDILFELGDHGARQHVHLALFVALDIRQRRHFRGKEFTLHQLFDAGAVHTLDQHLHGAVRELQQLQDGRHRAHAVEIVGFGVVDIRLFLGDQENPLVGLHGEVEGDDGFLAPNEERDHHVRVHHHVAQRQNGHPVQNRC